MNSNPSSNSSAQPAEASPEIVNVETGVSRYDLLSGAMSAAIALFGFLATILFLIWLTTAFKFDREVEANNVPWDSYGDEKPEGYEDDVLEPGVEEFPEIEEPALKDSLEAVTDALSSVSASLAAIDGDSPVVGSGSGAGSTDGGEGTGNSDVVPEHSRWKIEYASDNIGTYADQLSYFRIDIGVVSINSNEIVRVKDPGGELRTENSNRAREAKAKSLYFGHAKKKLKRWDVRLASQAGVNLAGGDVFQFYPNETRVLLRSAEAAYVATKNHTIQDIGKTFFRIVPAGNGFAFEVSSMQFRRR